MYQVLKLLASGLFLFLKIIKEPPKTFIGINLYTYTYLLY